jgi:hypothetical protein
MTFLALVLSGTQAVAPAVTHVPRDVDTKYLQGQSICLDNGDGTRVFVDSPSEEWRWMTYPGENLWFAVRRRPGQSSWTDHLYIERIAKFPSANEFEASLKAEFATGGPRGGTQKHDLLIESVDVVEQPEAGTLRAHLTLRYERGIEARVASYLTPNRYSLNGPRGSGPAAARFTAFVASYRSEMGGCAGNPEK